jgi:hypothetical protein
MKFYNYLNEKDYDLEKFNNIIQRDCKHYLNFTKGVYMFKRGMQNENKDFGVKQVRQDRQPRAMNSWEFKELNKWLEENNHVRRDKAMIAANLKGSSSIFGSVYHVFPIGKFNYTWLWANDINLNDSNTNWKACYIREFLKFGKEKVPEFEVYFHTNEGIKEAWKNEYETWFECKQYYFFSASKFGWNSKEKGLVKLWNFKPI